VKIAISAEGTDLEAKVAHKFGTSQYFVIVDLDSNDFEAVPNPGTSGHRGAGTQAVLTGYCSPAACSQLKANGIEVLTGLSGTVRDVMEKHKESNLQKRMEVGAKPETSGSQVNKVALAQVFKTSAKQFVNMLPILVGVVLLIGLFNIFLFLPKDFPASIFSSNLALDAL